VSYVSLRDVAKVVASVADPDSEVTRTYLPLGGPDALTSREVVRVFEEESGRRLHVVHAPSVLARGLGAILRPFDPATASILGMAAHMAERGDVLGPTEVIRGVLPKPFTVRDHARLMARAALTERVRVLLGGAGGTRY
jgi:uncharacterized protein YbjT (DUF2867 family)